MNKPDNNTRERIFSRLQTAVTKGRFNIPEPEKLSIPSLNRDQKIDLLKKNMEAVKSEVYVLNADSWADSLKDILKSKKVSTLLYGHETEMGSIIAQSWKDDSQDLPELTVYDGDIENFKQRIFEIDAGITSTQGAIADTGALILWPDIKEPRLISLVPQIHIAVLDADRIFNTFSEAIEQNRWAEQMPTNALLISGPSKTADIELTLAFGVHGPKELIVLILK